MGDSITNGIGDFYPDDNISLLERFIGARGPQATLIDQLDQSRPFTPALVYNEGIGGDETYDAAFVRIDSILERHPAANRVLIGLGTNDAFTPLQSGLGCTGAACDGTYKGNLQTLVNRIVWADFPNNTVPSGVAVSIARIPPAWVTSTPWSSTANNLIRQYNQVIENEISNADIGPDFFNYFMPAQATSTHRKSMFSDNLHPNSLGYLVMATLWHNALVPESPEPLPFVLEDIKLAVKAEAKQELLTVGSLYRTTTSHQLTSIPSVLAGGRWIRTPNNTSNGNASYLRFTVDRTVDVYVAYDGGSTARPNWMQGFVATGLSVGTTDANGPQMKLYVRTYNAGQITLGGNKASGSAGSNTNYVTIVVEH
ncbi:MAG: SGNH/GDSL hydrolase family protein [Pseudomonadales bacterium]